MRSLCAAADVILPNITEAALLTERSTGGALSESYIRKLTDELLALGAKAWC
ncbi:MAG: hypothetical protein ACLTSK_00260 [Christensenellales bacterium]